jgi:predicted nucleic-acid-binding protein
VLAELVWVLGSSYRYTRAQIAAAIETLLTGDDRVVEQSDGVRASLDDYRSGRLAFTDALIGHINRAQGCTTTVTFDRKASRLAPFRQVR